jgi:hypothetical protein
MQTPDLIQVDLPQIRKTQQQPITQLRQQDAELLDIGNVIILCDNYGERSNDWVHKNFPEHDIFAMCCRILRNKLGNGYRVQHPISWQGLMDYAKTVNMTRQLNEAIVVYLSYREQLAQGYVTKQYVYDMMLETIKDMGLKNR